MTTRLEDLKAYLPHALQNEKEIFQIYFSNFFNIYGGDFVRKFDLNSITWWTLSVIVA